MASSPVTLRVFVSSPGDVLTERELARKVMRALEANHLLRGKIRFDVVSWDDDCAAPPMDARQTPQASVNRFSGRPAECDLTLVILWSRIGTPLPSGMVRADGSAYASGTVWEYEDAISAGRSVFVYRRTSKPQIDVDDEEVDVKRTQYDAVKRFFAGFTNRDGSLAAGVNTYLDPAAFEGLLRQHLEAFVNDRLADPDRQGDDIATDDRRVLRIETLIDEMARKNRLLDEKDAEIGRLMRENEALRRTAIARTLNAAAHPDASPETIAAAEALEAGNTEPAVDVLRTQERELVAAIESPGLDETRGRTEAAELARQQGALAIGNDIRAALQAYRRAAVYDPDDVATRFSVGDLERRLGDLDAAMSSYAKGASIAEARVARDSSDFGAMRDVSTGHVKIGDVLRYRADGPGALVAYRKSLAVRKTLVDRDPSNTDWLRDLSVSHNKIGDVLQDRDDGLGALAAYREALSIRERLTALDPANARWQRDLSVSHSRIGDVLRDQGDGPGALASYRKDLAIAEALAASNPADTGLQRDLSVSYSRMGNVLRDQGDRAGALALFRKDLAIAEALAARDPANSEWQRDLSVSVDKVGGLLLEQGDASAALTSFRKALAIRRSLTELDPDNAEWRRDLSVSCCNVGDLLHGEGDEIGALQNYREAFAICEGLVELDGSNALWQRDLADLCRRLGAVRSGQSSEQRRAYLIRGRAVLAALESRGGWLPEEDPIQLFDDLLAELRD